MSGPTAQGARYGAVEISVGFDGVIEGQPLEYEGSSHVDSTYWGVNYDDLGKPVFGDIAELERQTRKSIGDHISRLSSHFQSLGGMRADGVSAPWERRDTWITNGDDINFFLVFDDPDSSYDGHRFGDALASINGQTIANAAFPGSTITFQTGGSAVDAAGLFEILSKREQTDGVGRWGGEPAAERLPRPDESEEEWLARVAVSGAEIARLADNWDLAGRDIDLFARYAAPRREDRPQWLVDGIVPFGGVTLLVGSGEAGKSSAAHELLSVAAAGAGSRPKTWLGREIDGRFPTALFSGEEDDQLINLRQARHETIWPDCHSMLFVGNAQSLRDQLAMLERIEGGLLVVDSARAYMAGDETKSHVVKEFYAPLVDFALRKRWAVVVIHHLVKSPSTGFARMIPSVLGATTHTNVARMVIAMIGRGEDLVEIAPIKHNYPAEMVWARRYEGQLFRRDAATFTLIPVGVEAPEDDGSTSNLDELVLGTIGQLNRADTIVRKSGRSGLFELKIAELVGVSRSKLGAAVARLLSAARLVDAPTGLRVVTSPP